MTARVITGLIGVPISVVLVFWPGGIPFVVAVTIVALVGTSEFYSQVRRTGARPVEWAGLLAVIVFVLSARTHRQQTVGLSFSVLIILSFLTELLRTRRSPVVNLGATMLGAVYVGWLLSHVVMLRGLRGTVTVGRFKSTAGAWLVMYVFLCTWACDTVAYFVGRYYGRTKLAPKLSPGKTIEGSVGGLVGSIIVAAVFGALIRLPAWHSLAMGVLIGILAQLGDLTESAVKREIGIKDFGTIMPGHGGVLDRFDSLLFTGTASYYYVVYFLQHWP
ncbi:MAG: phosphatidate cytidylyltransferase [Armatimonadota bacterium]|nr:phosphatidate cytidylyltransferase [Armatimonadota bacterium]